MAERENPVFVSFPSTTCWSYAAVVHLFNFCSFQPWSLTLLFISIRALSFQMYRFYWFAQNYNGLNKVNRPSEWCEKTHQADGQSEASWQCASVWRSGKVYESFVSHAYRDLVFMRQASKELVTISRGGRNKNKDTYLIKKPNNIRN